MASVLASVSSGDLCCGPWPNWALSHRPLSSPGICNPVRGKQLCHRIWLLLVPRSLLQGRRVLFSFLFRCSEVMSLELGYPYNYFFSGLYVLRHFRYVSGTLTSQEMDVPQLKSSHEGQPSACGVLAVPTQTICWGIDVPANMVACVKNRISIVFSVGNPVPTPSFYASTSALSSWSPWMIFLCQKVTYR